MTAVVNVQIEGASQLAELLKQLPDAIARQALQSALNAGGDVVKTELQHTAPVGRYGPGGVRVKPTAKREKFGSLLKNLRRGHLQPKLGGVLAIGVGIGSAFWGKFDEFGTRHQPARPWFRRAWETSRSRALAVIVDKLRVEAVNRLSRDLADRLGVRRSRR